MMSEYLKYKHWLEQDLEDRDLAEELAAINGDEEAIKDRFYRDLEFGTAGLRGVLGAGTNRMNIYTVRRATQGLAEYLNAAFKDPSVSISYDSRIKSDVFAKEAARVLDAWRLTDCTVYVTLEPCIMCAGLMHQARVARCVYGAPDQKAGAVGTLYDIHADTRLNHQFEATGGVCEEECVALLRDFFRARRRKEKERE